MRFISLTIKQGLFQDRFNFCEGANIVHSNKNSVGKTTLLRFLMFSLGYPIPGTRGINFARYDLDAEIVNAKNEVCHILRTGDYITFIRNGEERGYSLPSDLNALHMQVFGILNEDVIENLLGAYYIDQEKGWTLLNRGKAIGSIHFSIEGLIRGLSNRSDDDLAARLSATKRELQKYRHMLDIAQYQAEINELGEVVVYDAPLDEIERTLDILYSERKPVSDELERLKKVIRQNTSFKNFITAYQLRVLSSVGEEIPVNENTIVGYKDDNECIDITPIITKNPKTNFIELMLNKDSYTISAFINEIHRFESLYPKTFHTLYDNLISDMKHYLGQSLDKSNPIKKLKTYKRKQGVYNAYLHENASIALEINEELEYVDLANITDEILSSAAVVYTILSIHLIKRLHEYEEYLFWLNWLPPMIYKPDILFERARIQSGFFIVQAFMHHTEPMYEVDVLARQRIMYIHKIKITEPGKVLKELDNMGINRATIYGDFDNIAKHIVNICRTVN